MRYLIIILGVLVVPLASRGQEAPFSPVSDVPDYVATMTLRDEFRPTGTQTIRHHAGWTRIDPSAPWQRVHLLFAP